MPTPDLDVLGWTEEQGEEFTNKVESEFALWAESKDCDLTRTQNFYELQSLVFRSTLESGDTTTLLPSAMPWGFRICVSLSHR